MQVAILAVLGILPCILLVGVLILLLRNRNQFKKTPGVFPARLRIESGSYPGIDNKWSRSTSYAHRVHDVLLVHTGLPLVKSTPLPVDGDLQAALELLPEDFKASVGENYNRKKRLEKAQEDKDD